jgi:ferredoxin
MKVSIDKELCTGCGLCVESVPDVFEMSDDDIAVVKIKTIKDVLVDQVKEASEDCPAEAIILEE